MVNQNQSAGNASGNATGTLSPSFAERPSLPMRSASIMLSELIDLYMAQYSGRDSARVQRLSWWRLQLGSVSLGELTDDQIHSCLEALAEQNSRYFAGQDADGRAIYRAKKKHLAPATINRYLASLAAVITWAIRRRIAPRGFVHPCRTVERQPENNERCRFLSDEERQRLLDSCKAARWPKLHLLVLMALTTGARKGELLSLKWGDIDLDRCLAICGRSKNGDPKALPLVPPVITLLKKFEARDGSLVFCSHQVSTRPFSFEAQFAKVLIKARIKSFRFHDLRHSCASMLAASGATLLEIADVLGHRQLQMTKRYSHLTTAHKAALINRVLGDLT